jgi:hypothetical protein
MLYVTVDERIICSQYEENMTNTITDADILDIVRKLRTYTSSLDNCHQVLDSLVYIGDAQISSGVSEVLPDIINTTKKISVILKLLENSRNYRDMIKHFNIGDFNE